MAVSSSVYQEMDEVQVQQEPQEQVQEQVQEQEQEQQLPDLSQVLEQEEMAEGVVEEEEVIVDDASASWQIHAAVCEAAVEMARNHRCR